MEESLIMAYQFDPSWSMFVKSGTGSLEYMNLQELLAEQQLGFEWIYRLVMRYF